MTKVVLGGSWFPGTTCLIRIFLPPVSSPKGTTHRYRQPPCQSYRLGEHFSHECLAADGA